MDIELLRDPSGFDRLAGEWNSLVERGVSKVPLLRLEYHRTCLSTLVWSEWPGGELVLAVGRDGAGRVAGIAPLFFCLNRDARPALMFVGSIEISDYLDLIVSPEALPAFSAALLNCLSSPALPAWGVIDLYNLPEASPTRQALAAAARGRGWTAAEAPLQASPYIPIPGDWDAYLDSLDKKQRHEIRRKMRRVEAAEGGSRWYTVTDPATLDAEVEDFMTMMATDPEKARFLTPRMRTQFVESAREAFRNGWLHLAFLEIGGRKAAAYMNFDYDNRFWVYNSAIQPDFLGLSAGWVLLSHLIQWSNEHQRTAFDFMRGDEAYKYRFGAVNSRVFRLLIDRENGSSD